MPSVKLAVMLRKAFKTEAEALSWTELKSPDIKFKYHKTGGGGGILFFLTFKMPDGQTVFYEVSPQIVKKWHSECKDARETLWERNSVGGAMHMLPRKAA